LPASTGQAPSIELTSGFKSATPGGVFGSGAASAPAPAREHQDAHVADATPASPAKDAAPTVEAVAAESHTSNAAASTFTFGGANVPAESSGGSKKILLGVAAAVIVAAGLYFGWTYFQGRGSQPASQPAPTSSSPAPVETVPATTKPSSALPKAASTTPASSSPSSGSSMGAQAAPDTATRSTASDTESAPEDNDRSDAPSSTKSATTGGKVSSSAKTAASPLVIKGGAVPAAHIKPTAAPDASAPSMIGLATTGSSAPPPDLVSSSASAPKPVLQTLNISQGVSQGLLVKKVQPQYPRNALSMHVEGAVELIATISTSGNISKVKILSGEKLLTGAAVDAVKQWKYRPYLLNGEPVEIQTQITVNFKLPH
jgi:protein TonB